MKLSIFDKIKYEKVDTCPFPHIIIKNVLEEEIVEKLYNEFPNEAYNNKDLKPGERLNIPFFDYVKEGKNWVNAKVIKSKIWKEFISVNQNPELIPIIIDKFKDYINFNESEYFKNYEDLKNKIKNNYFNFYNSIGINAPFTDKSQINKILKKIHVDNNNKFISGLFYFDKKVKNYNCGMLELHKWKNNINKHQKLICYRDAKVGINEKYTEKIKEFETSSNVMIIFLNSIDALHAARAKDLLNHYRKFMYFSIASLNPVFRVRPSITEKIFNLNRYIENKYF